MTIAWGSGAGTHSTTYCLVFSKLQICYKPASHFIKKKKKDDKCNLTLWVVVRGKSSFMFSRAWYMRHIHAICSYTWLALQNLLSPHPHPQPIPQIHQSRHRFVCFISNMCRG